MSDTTNTQTTDTTQETTEADARETVTLTTEQEIGALRAAHQFFSNFDRVPGFLASQWSQALDTIAVVANSLINKNAPTTEEGVATTESEDTTVTQ